MKPLPLILLLGMNLLWAGTYPIFKVLGEQLTAGQLATLRYALAMGLLLAAWPWLAGRAPRGRDLLRAGLIGVAVFCLAPRLQIEGVHRGKAGDTSLLMALDPLITALAAAVFLREHVPARRWGGFAVGMAGVALLSNVWHGAEPLRGMLPNLLFLSSFVCETAYSVIGKPMLPRVGLMKLLATALLAGTAANLTWELASGVPPWEVVPQLSLASWGWMLYLAAVCTVVGYALWYWVIREAPVNLAGLTILVQPLAGLALSVAWLGESLHWGQLWGSAVIVLGLILGLRLERSPRPLPRPTSDEPPVVVESMLDRRSPQPSLPTSVGRE